MTTQQLIEHYPRAYHMAESGTWESIRRHGLLSAVALLDLFEINGSRREEILQRHRPESVSIVHSVHGKAVIRDQKPMRDSALEKCLCDGLTPKDWYLKLNQRVFFWVSQERLNRLLSARAYRSQQHCILTVDTAEMVRRHANHITLAHINSGSTIYTPQPRGKDTFRSIAEYPFDYWRRKRSAKDAVVELVVEYAVPDVADVVLRVEERRGENIIERLYSR